MKQIFRGTAMVLIVLSLGISIGMAAGNFAPKTLTGKYAVYGKTLIDPDLNEPQDSNFYFFLEGQSAKDMYSAMKEEATVDACRGDGSLSKMSGNIICVESPEKAYECSFSVNLSTKTIEGGLAC